MAQTVVVAPITELSSASMVPLATPTSPTGEFKRYGIGDPVGDWKPTSVAAYRIENLAKLLGIRFRKSKSTSTSKQTEVTSKETVARGEQKSQDLGYIHYKTWLNPIEPGKKRILNLTIIEAERLEQGVLSRYPYVKITHGEEVYKTPPTNKATSNPHWGLNFKLEVEEEDTSTVLIEVWAQRAMAADWVLGRTTFYPGLHDLTQPLDVWEPLWTVTSSAVKQQYEITVNMLKIAHRVAKRARERTPEALAAKRNEIRAKKAQSIKQLKESISAAGWGHALVPVTLNKKRRIPPSLSKHLPVIFLGIFLFVFLLIAFVPDELLTLIGR